MQLHPNSLEAYYLLHNGTLALARAESNGIRVDVQYLENKIFHLTRKIDRLDRKFKESKFYKDWEKSQEKEPNPNSSVQLSTFLYDEKKIKPPKTTATGRGSTDKDTLADLNIPELNYVLDMRKLKKIRDTYLEGFLKEQVDGWIHPFFHLNLVTTYRSSSSMPNLQNIPKRDEQVMKIVRGAMYPRKGHQLLEVDYSGLEVRISCAYHKDPVMIKYIETGHDMHADLTKQIFFLDFDKSIPGHGYLRSASKNGFVFPQFYGDYFKNCAVYLAKDWGKLPLGRWKSGQGVELGDETLSDHLMANGVSNITAFEKHLKEIEQDFWGNRFKHYARWKERWWRQYQKDGFVDLLTGFRCSGVLSRNEATNIIIQGAAFHCLLWSLIEIDRLIQRRGWKSRIVGEVHDSIIFDVYPPELDELVKETIKITTEELPKTWDWINVPLSVDFEICDVDASWAEKKELVLT